MMREGMRLTYARARPLPAERKANDIVCFRCGIAWIDQSYKWASDAPCTDCREQLAADGVIANPRDTAQWKRRKSAA